MNIRTIEQFTKHTSKSVRDLAETCLRFKRELEDVVKSFDEFRQQVADMYSNRDSEYYRPDVDLTLKPEGPQHHALGEDWDTFDGWKERGRVVNKGEKCNARDVSTNNALFHVKQTVPIDALGSSGFNALRQDLRDYGIQVYEDANIAGKYWLRKDGRRKIGITATTLKGFDSIRPFLRWYDNETLGSHGGAPCPRDKWVEFKTKASSIQGLVVDPAFTAAMQKIRFHDAVELDYRGAADEDTDPLEYPEQGDPYFDNIGDR